jgi:predicted site-specific integrase-resolvase
VPRVPGELIVIGEPVSISPSGITAVDARVSSADQAVDLDLH